MTENPIYISKHRHEKPSQNIERIQIHDTLESSTNETTTYDSPLSVPVADVSLLSGSIILAHDSGLTYIQHNFQW